MRVEKINASRVITNADATHEVYTDLTILELKMRSAGVDTAMDSTTGEIITLDDIAKARTVVHFFKDGFKVVEFTK